MEVYRPGDPRSGHGQLKVWRSRALRLLRSSKTSRHNTYLPGPQLVALRRSITSAIIAVVIVVRCRRRSDHSTNRARTCSGEFISPLLAPEARHTLAPPRKGGEPNHSKIASAFGVGATQNSAALSQTPRTLPPRGRDARKCRPPAELRKSLRARQISTPAYFCPSAQL